MFSNSYTNSGSLERLCQSLTIHKKATNQVLFDECKYKLQKCILSFGDIVLLLAACLTGDRAILQEQIYFVEAISAVHLCLKLR